MFTTMEKDGKFQWRENSIDEKREQRRRRNKKKKVEKKERLAKLKKKKEDERRNAILLAESQAQKSDALARKYKTLWQEAVKRGKFRSRSSGVSI